MQRALKPVTARAARLSPKQQGCPRWRKERDRFETVSESGLATICGFAVGECQTLRAANLHTERLGRSRFSKTTEPLIATNLRTYAHETTPHPQLRNETAKSRIIFESVNDCVSEPEDDRESGSSHARSSNLNQSQSQCQN